MSDAEEPALRPLDRARVGQGLRRLGESLLHHVLAFEGGADHACAIAMQARAELRHQPVESLGPQACVHHALPFCAAGTGGLSL